jgi:hypothetical protein
VAGVWLKASIQKRDPQPGSGAGSISRISEKGGLYFIFTDRPGENPGVDPSEHNNALGGNAIQPAFEGHRSCGPNIMDKITTDVNRP